MGACLLILVTNIGRILPSETSFKDNLNALLDILGAKRSGCSRLLCKIDNASLTWMIIFSVLAVGLTPCPTLIKSWSSKYSLNLDSALLTAG